VGFSTASKEIRLALKLPGQWVWDSWFVFDGQNHHAFYLQASRALGDQNRRHRNVTVGHAISTDLKNWTVVADALAPSESPAADSWTTWTGSVVQNVDGIWWMFYTGTSREDAGERQTVCAATSKDLMTWTKLEPLPLVAADARWYKTLAAGFSNEPFRDPWVFKLPGDEGWTMLTTAGSPAAKSRSEEAIMGVAKSTDLLNWQLQPPLGGPGQGFGETEVFQFEIVDGVPIVLFCCGPLWLSPERKASGEIGGVYSMPVAPDLSDVDFNRAVLFPDLRLYASRLVKDRDGGWNLIAFLNNVDGEFLGELSDPIPVTADPVLGLIPRAQ
jgi:beta-fructofuranosidase